MSWLKKQRRERTKRQASGILLAVGLVVGVVAIAPAFATELDPTCTATVDDSANTVTLDWSNLPDGIQVWANYPTVDDWSQWTDIVTDLPESVVGYGTSGTYTFSPIPSDALAYNLWTTEGDVACTTQTPPPTDPDLGATIELSCETGEIIVAVTNNGSAAGVAYIHVNADEARLDVAAGATETWRLPISIDESYDVSVHDAAPDGEVIAWSLYEDSCHTPEANLSASVALDCSSTAVSVTVVNHGDGDGIASITVNGQTEDLAVAAGSTETWRAPVTAGTDYSIVVTTSGRTIAAQSYDSTCHTPTPSLRAKIDVDCDSLLLVVTVSNDGDAEGTASISLNGAATEITVAAGATGTWTREVSEGSRYEASVTAGGEILASRVFEQACHMPMAEMTASITMDCSNHELVITGVNTGDAEGHLIITVNGIDGTLDVPAGGTARWWRSISEGSTYDVSVHWMGHSLVSQRFVESCRTPSPALSASIAADCATNMLVVTVKNTGDVEGTATVTVGDRTAALIVPAGETRTWRSAITQGAVYDVRVVAADQTIAQSTFTDTCHDPKASLSAAIALDCGTGAISVTLVNSGDLAGTARVTVNANLTDLQAAPGQTVTWTTPIMAGTTYDVSVKVGDETLATQQYVHSCVPQQPAISAAIVLDCAGQAVVTVRNAGAQAGNATVKVDGAATAVTVAAGETKVLKYPLTAGQPISIEVLVDGIVITREQQTPQCGGAPQAPTATLAISCSTNLATATLANPTSATADFVVNVNGTKTTYSVPAGATKDVTQPLVEDSRYDLSVTYGLVTLGSKAFTHNCVDVLTEMEMVTEFTPMQLPRTGANTFGLTIAGLSMLVAGGFALSASKDRKTRLNAG